MGRKPGTIVVHSNSLNKIKPGKLWKKIRKKYQQTV